MKYAALMGIGDKLYIPSLIMTASIVQNQCGSLFLCGEVPNFIWHRNVDLLRVKRTRDGVSFLR
jgi:hypothetical protein